MYFVLQLVTRPNQLFEQLFQTFELGLANILSQKTNEIISQSFPFSLPATIVIKFLLSQFLCNFIFSMKFYGQYNLSCVLFILLHLHTHTRTSQSTRTVVINKKLSGLLDIFIKCCSSAAVAASPSFQFCGVCGCVYCCYCFYCFYCRCCKLIACNLYAKERKMYRCCRFMAPFN